MAPPLVGARPGGRAVRRPLGPARLARAPPPLLLLLPLLLARAAAAAAGGGCAADRLEREAAAWRAACAAPGTAAGARWAEYAANHARARAGGPARVLVLQEGAFAQGVGNAVQTVQVVAMHAWLTRRALFINVSAPQRVAALAGAPVPRFDPAAHFAAPDGVDYALSGPAGDALAARWRAAGMRERATLNLGCGATAADDAPSLGAEAEPLWLSVRSAHCYARITGRAAARLKASGAAYERCLAHAFTRPRPHVAAAVRAALGGAAAAARCGAAGSPGVLSALHVRTGVADHGAFFDGGPRGGWAGMEAAFVRMLDRGKLGGGARDAPARPAPAPGRRRLVLLARAAKPKPNSKPKPKPKPAGGGLDKGVPRLSARAFAYACAAPRGAARRRDRGGNGSLTADFGGLRRFAACALAAAAPGAPPPPRVHSTLARWPSRLPAAPPGCAADSNASRCAEPALFVAADSPQLLTLLRSTFGPRLADSSGAGGLLHTGVSRLNNSPTQQAMLREAAGGGAARGCAPGAPPLACAYARAATRAVADWYALSLADALWTVGAHYQSSYALSALGRSMLTRTHVDYFDGVPKLLCAARGRCAARTNGRPDDAGCAELVAGAAAARALLSRCALPESPGAAAPDAA